MSTDACCPDCASTLLHPQRSRARSSSGLTLDLRCAECSRWIHRSYSARELLHLDAEQTAGREALLQSYERCVNESMEALAESLRIALAQDLVGPDDFAPRRLG